MWAGAVALFRDLLVNYGAAQLSALGAAFVGAALLAFVLFKREPFHSFRLRKRSTVEALFILGTVFLLSGAAGVGIWVSVGKWGPVSTKPLDAKDVAEEVARRLQAQPAPADKSDGVALVLTSDVGLDDHPGRTIHVVPLVLLPDSNYWSWVRRFEKLSGTFWPYPTSRTRPHSVSRWKLTNYGNAPVFKVTLALKVDFREPVSGKGTWKGSGKVIFSRIWIVDAEQIDAGRDTPFVFYAANLTHYYVKISTPERVIIEPLGETQRKEVRIKSVDNVWSHQLEPGASEGQSDADKFEVPPGATSMFISPSVILTLPPGEPPKAQQSPPSTTHDRTPRPPSRA
jgi:hypothetical protein